MFRIRHLGQLLASSAKRNDSLWVGCRLLLCGVCLVLSRYLGYCPSPPLHSWMHRLAGLRLGQKLLCPVSNAFKKFLLKTRATGRHFGVESRVTTKCLPSCPLSSASVMETSSKARKRTGRFSTFPRAVQWGSLHALWPQDIWPPLVLFRWAPEVAMSLPVSLKTSNG